MGSRQRSRRRQMRCHLIQARLPYPSHPLPPSPHLAPCCAFWGSSTLRGSTHSSRSPLTLMQPLTSCLSHTLHHPPSPFCHHHTFHHFACLPARLPATRLHMTGPTSHNRSPSSKCDSGPHSLQLPIPQPPEGRPRSHRREHLIHAGQDLAGGEEVKDGQ